MRRANKVALARVIAERMGISLDPDALFDVQIKRIHEYKRQLLNILETIALYDAIRAEPTRDWVPRVKIFAGKAAASYQQAKLIIKLINDVAQVVNGDPSVRGLLKVRVPAQLQRQPGRSDHPCRRPVGADLHRRHGGLRHRQHEVGAERRADHRHAGRRQHRDARPRRRRQLLHLRAHARARWTRRRRAGIDARDTIAASPALAQVLDADRVRRVFAGRPRRVSMAWRTIFATTTTSWSPPTSTATARRRRSRRALAASARLVAQRDRQYRERRLVLFRPRHRRVRERDLASEGRTAMSVDLRSGAMSAAAVAGAGSPARLYEALGAHAVERDGVAGVRFAVWAPRASRVSVVGDFNGWDGERHRMRRQSDTGVWEIFVPAVRDGEFYKYEIRRRRRRHCCR